jgi:hypothetical protein
MINDIKWDNYTEIIFGVYLEVHRHNSRYHEKRLHER